jgi:hypothetical protein
MARKNNRSKQDLTAASDAMRNPRTPTVVRRIAAQDLAEHRWLVEKERQLASRKGISRTSSNRSMTSNRSRSR